MRPSEIRRLKDLIDKQKSFKLVPYGNGWLLTFKARKSFWVVSSGLFLSYPDELKVEVENEEPRLVCYVEGGYVMSCEFNLANFYEVVEAHK